MICQKGELRGGDHIGGHQVQALLQQFSRKLPFFLHDWLLRPEKKGSIIWLLRYEPDKANPFFGCESRFTEVTLW